MPLPLTLDLASPLSGTGRSGKGRVNGQQQRLVNDPEPRASGLAFGPRCLCGGDSPTSRGQRMDPPWASQALCPASVLVVLPRAPNGGPVEIAIQTRRERECVCVCSVFIFSKTWVPYL